MLSGIASGAVNILGQIIERYFLVGYLVVNELYRLGLWEVSVHFIIGILFGKVSFHRAESSTGISLFKCNSALIINTVNHPSSLMKCYKKNWN